MSTNVVDARALQLCLSQPSVEEGTIIDIGGSALHEIFKPRVLQSICPSSPTIHPLRPSALMWDDVGLDMWRQLNQHKDYNQMWDELELLDHNVGEIVKNFEKSGVILDLGSGDSRKSQRLLDALDDGCSSIKYYAIDLSKKSLEDNMASLLGQNYQHIQCYAIWGDFSSAQTWLAQCQRDAQDTTPHYFCSFGSQFGNDYFEDAVARFQEWSSLLRENDRFLIGMDGMTDAARLWNSYHDSDGLFERYIRNGFIHSNRVLQQEWYTDEDWSVVGEISQNPTMHRFVLTANQMTGKPSIQTELDNINESAPCTPNSNTAQKTTINVERVHCYEAFKYGPEEMQKQFDAAGYGVLATWKAPHAPYYQYWISYPNGKTLE